MMSAEARLIGSVHGGTATCPGETGEAMTHANSDGQATPVLDSTLKAVKEEPTLEREEEIGCWDGIPQAT